MSTMLKTAAMTLLSKTLQTFLYKYLLDVDVEGVALPSLYDSDGHSGWGVRLCNVKLREGVELLEVLPGAKRITKTRRVKKKVMTKSSTFTTATAKRKKKGQNHRHHHQQHTPLPTNRDDDEQDSNKQNHHNKQANGSNHTTITTTTRRRRTSNDKESVSSSSVKPKIKQTEDDEDDVVETEESPLIPPAAPSNQHQQQQRQQQQEPSHQHQGSSNHNTHYEDHEQDETTMEQQTVAESDTDNDDDAASYAGSYISSGPPTPPSAGGFLSNCFTSSATAAPTGISPEKPNHKKVKVVNGETIHAMPQLDLKMKEGSLQDEPNGVNPSTKTKIFVEDGDEDESEDDTEEEEYEHIEDEEEEDEEYIYEERMGLRLGKGGRIGVLDVRLIGKDLHVLVEDAFLTIEAIPKDPSYVDDSKKQETNKPAEKTADAAKKAKEARTVGEKIMAENPLARALAAIPHLFLRDIHIRLIMRDQSTASSKPTPSSSEEYDDDIGERDCALEFGIEFLSVASGEDLLGQFRTDDDNVPAAHHQQQHHHEAAAAAAAASADEKMHTSFSSLSELQNASDQHEYLSKRIRTGKGPEGGIWLKIIPPRWKLPPQSFASHNGNNNNSSVWARQHFLTASQYYFFRCSGLDIRTRTYLGTKKEIAIMNNEYVWYGNEYDEYTLDSLLYGVDYISTGSQPPLPPMVERKDSMSSVSGDKGNKLHTFQVDDNGIWSCPMRSSFHRVARGLKPSMCRRDHLPSDDCPHCWERQQSSSKAHGVGQQLHHALDSSLPMPGLVLNLTMKDPIEVNVDRPSLDVLGLILQLFTPSNSSATSEDSPKKADTENKQPKERKKSITGLLMGGKDRRKNDLRRAFPSYMQPQSIQIMGLYLSKIFIRVHAMRREDFDDLGLKFCYWDIYARCLTADFQELKATEQSYQDARFDVGGLTVSEFKGTEKKEMVSLEVPYNDGDVESELLSRMFISPESLLQPKSAWPSTASVLLHVPPPLDSHLFESRDRHALQLRYFSVITRKALEAYSHVNVRLGVTSVNMPLAIKDDIVAVVEEATASIVGHQNQTPVILPSPEVHPEKMNATVETSEPSARPKSTIRYKMRIDGGEVNVFPLISLRLPLTQFVGTQSSEFGVFLETCLDKLQMQFGESLKPVASGKSGTLDLPQLAALPESVRLRILLCLKDLKPLETALGVKKESNSFLRCRAVNKGLVKMAKRVMPKPLKQESSPSPAANLTRHQLLTELLKLDDVDLRNLLSIHESSK